MKGFKTFSFNNKSVKINWLSRKYILLIIQLEQIEMI